MNIRKVMIIIIIFAILVSGCGYDNGNKKEIMLAVLHNDSNIQRMVDEYNSHHDNKITIIEYWASGNPADYESAMVKFVSDLSGKKSPDIIYLDSQMNWYDYAEKDVFEALDVYIESSEWFRASDYFENALSCGRYESKQIAIPISFTLMTLIGDPKYVSQDGWTIDDFVKHRLDDKSVEILQPVSWEGTLNAALKYSIDEYIDWDAKKVNFETDSFYNLLEVLEGIEVSEKRNSELDGMIENGKLISKLLVLSTPSAISSYRDSFANNLVAVGFPSNKGEQINNIQGQYMFGLSANSESKQEGWDFIEYIHTNGYYGIGFPSQKGAFNKVMQEALTTDDEIMRITEAEYEFTLSILYKSQPWDYRTNKVITIIEEEVSSYINHQKSLEEVVSVINSRINLLVSE